MNRQCHAFRFSRTGLKDIRPSPTLSINDRVQEMRAAGRDIYHLGFGESRFPVHPLIARALQDNVQQRSYLPALGLPALRSAVAQFYTHHLHLDVSPQQVIVGPGSKSLIFAILAALDGDIIMPTPAWSSYKDLAAFNQRPILEVSTDPDNDYHPDTEHMALAIDEVANQWRQPDTLLLSNPHNPTATTLSHAEVNAIAEFARERDLVILSDEIYSQVTYEDNQHTTFAQNYPEGTIILGGLSKQMSVGGWRLGVAVLPPTKAGDALAQAIQAIAGCIWSCASAPVQFAAIKAYSGDPEIESYMRDCTQMHAIRTRYLHDALEEFGIPCPVPNAAFYLYPSFANWREPLAQRGVNSCHELSHYLLENYDIATLPGSTFGDDPSALALRFSTSYLDMETDEQAGHIVNAYKHESDPDRFINNHHPRMREVVSRLADFISELEEDQK